MTETVAELKNETGITSTIAECSSCKKHHENLHLEAYKVQSTRWTHWYQCPSTGDPVSLRMESSGDRQPMMDAICEKLEQVSGGQWCAAVFNEEGDRYHVTQWTHQINLEGKVDGDKVVADELCRILRDAFSKISGPPVAAPLKPAPTQLPPVVNLFGDQNEPEE